VVGVVVDVVERIHFAHLQALVVGRQLEHGGADGDDGRIQFDGVDLRLRELA
jgi:hypothetical protein